MKQIFDWLREQIYKHSYSKYDRGNLFASFIDSKIAIDLINEAEAKWELENTYRCNGNYNDNYKNALKVCPYCENPIKISEVE